MSKVKRLGIIFILIGICLPIITLGFASTYEPKYGLIYNIQTMEIVLRQREPKVEFLGTTEAEVKGFTPIVVQEPKPKIAIPYKDIFAFGVILVFAGIGIIVLSGNKQYGVK